MKKFLLIITIILLSSCNLKLGGETNISSENGEIKIKTNGNNELSIKSKDLDNLKNKTKSFLKDFGTFEKIYNKASKNISEKGIEALETSTNFLEKKYKQEIEKNPKLKENLDKINSKITEIKNNFKDGKISNEVKKSFNDIKNDIDKIRKFLQEK